MYFFGKAVAKEVEIRIQKIREQLVIRADLQCTRQYLTPQQRDRLAIAGVHVHTSSQDGPLRRRLEEYENGWFSPFML